MAPNVEPIRRLLANLVGSATAMEIADCLWLASYLPSSGLPATPRARAQLDPAESHPRDARVRRLDDPNHLNWPTEYPQEVEMASSRASIREVRSSALRGSLQILRSLRPLKRRAPSAWDLELDETATVDQIAERRMWLPVLRPVPDRWLDLAIVVDESPLAPLWRDTIAAFVDTCRYLGAFRAITIQNLRNVDGSAMLAGSGNATEHLRPARSLQTAGRQQLILIISDALGPNWETGAAASVMAEWGAQAAVALIQPLPERLWRHTWLDTMDGHLSAPHRGAANAMIDARTRRDGILRDPSGTLAIPVLELDRQWLRPWAHYTAGTSNRGIDAAIALVGEERRFLPVRPDPMPMPPDPVGQAFTLRTSVAPDTYRLAGLLAATAPLTIPIMRHVQEELLPQTGPAEIAELFLSRVFEPIAAAGDNVLCDFRPGLRAVLQSTLRYHEIADVVTTVAGYMREHHIHRSPPTVGSSPAKLSPKEMRAVSPSIKARPDDVDAMLQAEFDRVSVPLLSRLGMYAPELNLDPTT